MKHGHWELVIDGKVADSFSAWELDAYFHAKQLSVQGPLLTVELYQGNGDGRKLVSTWRKGKKVKS